MEVGSRQSNFCEFLVKAQLSKNTEKVLLRRKSTDFVLSWFDITVNCRDVIGRKHHNNSESCFSFCHCF